MEIYIVCLLTNPLGRPSCPFIILTPVGLQPFFVKNCFKVSSSHSNERLPRNNEVGIPSVPLDLGVPANDTFFCSGASSESLSSINTIQDYYYKAIIIITKLLLLLQSYYYYYYKPSLESSLSFFTNCFTST